MTAGRPTTLTGWFGGNGRPSVSVPPSACSRIMFLSQQRSNAAMMSMSSTCRAAHRLATVCSRSASSSSIRVRASPVGPSPHCRTASRNSPLSSHCLRASHRMSVVPKVRATPSQTAGRPDTVTSCSGSGGIPWPVTHLPSARSRMWRASRSTHMPVPFAVSRSRPSAGPSGGSANRYPVRGSSQPSPFRITPPSARRMVCRACRWMSVPAAPCSSVTGSPSPTVRVVPSMSVSVSVPMRSPSVFPVRGLCDPVSGAPDTGPAAGSDTGTTAVASDIAGWAAAGMRPAGADTVSSDTTGTVVRDSPPQAVSADGSTGCAETMRRW